MLNFSESAVVEKKGNDCTKRKAKQAGDSAARRGYKRATEAKLAKHGYNKEEIKIYYEGYDSYKISESEREIKRANTVGYSLARNGGKQATVEELVNRGYTLEQIAAYHKGYDGCVISESERKIKRAKAAGYGAAKKKCKRATEEKLVNRGYTPEQIAAYHEGYDGCVIPESERKIKRAKAAGYGAAKKKYKRTTEEKLVNRGYTPEQIAAYHEGYDGCVIPESERKIRRVKAAGYSAAKKKYKRATAAGCGAARRGYKRATEAKLAKHGYNEEEIRVYYESYDSYKISESERKIKRANTVGYNLARNGGKQATTEELANRGYTLEQIAAYHQGYDGCVISESERKIRRAKAAGYGAAKKKSKRATEEKLVNRGYTPEQIAAYYKEYDSCTKAYKKYDETLEMNASSNIVERIEGELDVNKEDVNSFGVKEKDLVLWLFKEIESMNAKRVRGNNSACELLPSLKRKKL
ncbi:hypothetical protein CC99x_001655 [Candidatus Berkiella cookevillensis]|uniref:Uncharacterized protein n=1 Tax=Candidatus Berkiella cookevillensis TaxID=437022 RepID=A0A0Q9YGE0_9GAMM|nr:hypothetical protein [Candidatus Berkiella cookevillensis]MCS5707603.1 hypothetical protein [Candidatus Berkiella cookevillensis]